MDIYAQIEAMTDEQVYDHLDKVNKRMAIATQIGSSGALTQLRLIADVARNVLASRQQAVSFKQQMAKNKSEIITDPGLMPEVAGDEPKKPTPSGINRIRVQRSERPASSIDLTASPSTMPSPTTEPDKDT